MRSSEHAAHRPLMHSVHIAPWLKSRLVCHPCHPCMRTCVLCLELSVFFLVFLSFYFLSLFLFQLYLMSTSALDEMSVPNPLCDSSLGSVVTSDYVTPLTKTKQNKTKQNKTKQNKTKQNKTKQNKTKQNKTKQNKTKQNKTKQNKTKQNKTKQNKTKQTTPGRLGRRVNETAYVLLSSPPSSPTARGCSSFMSKFRPRSSTSRGYVEWGLAGRRLGGGRGAVTTWRRRGWQFIDKVVDVLMQLKFQQSRVFHGQFIDRVLDISVGHRRYPQCKLCRRLFLASTSL